MLLFMCYYHMVSPYHWLCVSIICLNWYPLNEKSYFLIKFFQNCLISGLPFLNSSIFRHEYTNTQEPSHYSRSIFFTYIQYKCAVHINILHEMHTIQRLDRNIPPINQISLSVMKKFYI